MEILEGDFHDDQSSYDEWVVETDLNDAVEDGQELVPRKTPYTFEDHSIDHYYRKLDDY